MYDEPVFNERIRQLFNSIDSIFVSLPSNNINRMGSIVDALFPEQISLYQQQRDQRCSSTNDLTTAFDRFLLWNNNRSASSFCGNTTDGLLAFEHPRQSTLHGSSYSLRNTHHHQQQQYHYQPSLLTQPHFTSSTITTPTSNNINECQRSSSSVLTNNSSTTIYYQSRFADRLSTTRLPSTASAGSHDQIVGNINTTDPIAPFSSASAVFSRNTSTTNGQPQQPITMTQAATFCYAPASGSLLYNNLTCTDRSTTAPHH